MLNVHDSIREKFEAKKKLKSISCYLCNPAERPIYRVSNLVDSISLSQQVYRVVKLQAVLDAEFCQTQQKLADRLKAMGTV